MGKLVTLVILTKKPSTSTSGGSSLNSYKETTLIKDSSTGFIVGKYINVIDENKGMIDNEVKNQGQMLLEEATELIGTGK